MIKVYKVYVQDYEYFFVTDGRQDLTSALYGLDFLPVHMVNPAKAKSEKATTFINKFIIETFVLIGQYELRGDLYIEVGK